ncbi:MAG: hypothetical protein ACK5P4_11615 [Bacteroidota bacterium]|jgi:hypothetical protein
MKNTEQRRNKINTAMIKIRQLEIDFFNKKLNKKEWKSFLRKLEGLIGKDGNYISSSTYSKLKE